MRESIVTLIALVILWVIINILLAEAFSIKLSKIKHHPYEKRLKIEMDNKTFDLDWYNQYKIEPFFINSKYGYQVYGEMFFNPVKTNKTVVIMHGFGANLITSVKYAKMFLDFGFNSVVFDNTNCGLSGGEFTTMGLRELSDLSYVVKKARELTEEHSGQSCVIGLHGESLGGATTLRYLAEDREVAFLVEDCAYSDLFEELSRTAKRKVKVPKFPVMYISALICKMRYGYNMFSMSPIDSMKSNNGYDFVPIMFIHGTEDQTTPYYMVEELYEAKKGAKRKLTMQGAIHARSIVYDKEKYVSEVEAFLKENNII